MSLARMVPARRSPGRSPASRGPVRFAVAAILVLVAGSGAGRGPLAQSGIQATLAGIVVDKDGVAIPGVTVTARSTSSAMAPAVTITDGSGRFRLTPLPPANDYVVVAELPGYARIEIAPVDLDPGKTTTQNITLVPSSDMSQKITVVGKGDIVDVASTKTATVFNSEFIEGLPILGRTYQDILTLAPGVTDTDGDGNPNVNGARDTDFQTRVDGANTTDPVTGTFGQNLNLEAIAEIEIITTGASAEFSQAQGGFANIVTKSGSNDFEGSALFFFRSDMFDNDGANNNDLTDTNLLSGLDGFNDIRPFFTVGGPFVRDRLWYFMTLEYISLETPVNTLTFPALRTQEGWNNFFKLTWQISPSHRMAFQVNQDPARYTGQNLTTGVAPESDFIFDQGGATSTVRWTYNVSPSVLLETLVSYFDTGIDLLPTTDPEPCLTDENGDCNPFAEDNYTIDVRQGTVKGPFNVTSRDTRTRATLKSDLSLFLESGHGSHNVKTGFELAKEAFANRLTTRRIRFDDIQANPNRGLGGASLSGSINFQDYLPMSFPGTVAIERNLDGQIGPEDQVFEIPELTADKDNFGFYVQDSFKPMPNLTINLGLRYDREAATTDGYESFEPTQQAEDFLRMYEIVRGLPAGSATFQAAFGAPQPIYDLNGDGLDNLHCSAYDLDGDAYGDGLGLGGGGTIDDFWTYYDGDYDGVLNANDPDDVFLQQPDGLADGRYDNPLCDKRSDDTYTLISAFSRHQFDPTGEPFESLGRLDTERGLPGSQRNQETFTLVNNNVAPRFSISWDPWADNRTKLFATWSRFYDKLFLATLIPELGPDPRTVVYNPNDQTTAAVPIQTGRFSITQVDRGMKTPFTDEMTIGFEREIAPEWSILVSYVKRTGRDQLQDVDLNHYVQDLNHDGVFDDNFGRVGQVTGDAGGDGGGSGGGLAFRGFAVAPDGQPDLFALNPFFNQVLRVGNYNSSAYQSYQVVVTRRLSRQWQMNGSYVYSEAVGDAEDFLSGLGNDPGTSDDEFGPLSYDQTHRLVFSAVTFLPRSQSLGGTIEWTSGLPFSLVRRRESADSFGSFFFRTTYPTDQRNDQRNEGRWLINLAYKKNFVAGRANASVGVEVENLLNSDDLRIFDVDQELFLGVDAFRPFGRRWQLSAAFYF